jgi:hypothetical protein
VAASARVAAVVASNERSLRESVMEAATHLRAGTCGGRREACGCAYAVERVARSA